ncbi:protein C2-DOMAIN ABA-RELATED 9-like isoform X1 [Brassica napus]|uniref:protein C2-DOMAIN ABA-RELATED 9-like isoform X1 n=1 Tax=Brassica napus TaxID=3708 RepID=UPI0020791530|nr:protein C2-DOMAIN ABA-RELATED 9-like isoform X1 [Brassica napus]
MKKEGYVMCEKCEGRKNPKESKGAAMKSVIRKQRMDLSILFLEVLIESTSMFLVKLSYLSSNNVQFYKLYQIQVRVCVLLQYLMWVSLDLKKKDLNLFVCFWVEYAAMEDKQLGVMRVHVKRGINLAIRDSTTSDPYVVVTLANQKVKTRVINSNCNPVWDEQLALTIKDVTDPIRMTVYDKDRFSGDDKMGDAEIDMRPFLEAHQMELDFQKLPNGCAIKRIRPGRTNCLAEESSITWSNGKIIQDMILRLRNVECGELEIMLELADGPGCKGLGREGSKKTSWMQTKQLD